MGTIKFYLGKEGKKGESLIFLVYQQAGKKFKVSTKKKVKPKSWNIKTQRVRSSANSSSINDELDKFEEKLKQVIRGLKNEGGEFGIGDVKNRFLGNQIGVVETGLFEYFKQFIDNKRSSKRRKTLNEYTTIVNDLKEYEEKYNEKLTFEKFDDEFLGKYLELIYGKKKPNSVNTAAKKISTLKTMLRGATRANKKGTKEKLNTTMDFLDFKVNKVDTKKIILTEEELLLLYNHDLSKNAKLARVRDKFCFACLTGLRFSDLNNMKEEWLTEKVIDKKRIAMLGFKDQKTKTDISLPLNPLALKILKKYTKTKVSSDFKREGNLVFPPISSQKFNIYLKELGELVELNDLISVKKYVGVKRENKKGETEITVDAVEKVYKKYELLTSHAARRTFISLSLMRGAEAVAVQKTVGHKSLKTTMGYATILDDWKDEQISGAWDGFGESLKDEK